MEQVALTFGDFMPHFSIGDTVIYEDRTLTVHFVSDDLERVTCVYLGADRLFHSIELNANLLRKIQKR
jgi:hypothetical protein